MSVEEASILRLLLQLLAKQGIKYEEQTMKMLLMWLKTHGAPSQLHEVFDADNWEKASTLIWEAASRGDLTAAQIMTTWRVVTDNLCQIKADKKAAAAAAAVSAIAPQTSPEEMTASVGVEKTASTVRPKFQDLQTASIPPEGEQCKLVDASGQLPGFMPAPVAFPPTLPKEATLDGLDFDPKDRWAKLREEAIETGDLEAVSWSFPVLVRDRGPNEWQPFHWDLIKELRKTVVSYGLSAPFSQSLLENVFTGQLLTPYDICQLATMILTPTQKLLFAQRWQDLCAQEALANLEKQLNDPLHGAGLPQLLGQPPLNDPRLQARLDPAILRLTA